MANTIEQCEQAVKAFQSVPGPEGVDFKIACAAGRPDFSDRDIVIVDEAHHSIAASWLSTLVATKPDVILWFFTATPDTGDAVRDMAFRLLVEEVFSIHRSRVEASGHLEKGKVYMHDFDVHGCFDAEINRLTVLETVRRTRKFRSIPAFEHGRRAKWQITQQFIQNNENRNHAITYICNRAAGEGLGVLLLVNSIEHGGRLATSATGSVLVHSGLGRRARRTAIEGFRDGSVPILVATSLADEGLDCPRASCLVLAAGGRAPAKLEQRAGRVLRPFEGKKGGVIHDFMDSGAQFALAQARARMKVYDKLGYNPEIVSYK